MKAISVQGPLWWYVLHGICPLVNRADAERYRGPLLIQVSQTIAERDRVEAQQMALRAGWTGGTPDAAELRNACGCIVGMVEMVDCVETHPSPFFTGRYGHVYARPRIFREPVRYPGKLGHFEVPDAFVPAGAGVRPAGSVALDFTGDGTESESPTRRTFFGVDLANGDDYTAIKPLPSDPLQRRMF